MVARTRHGSTARTERDVGRIMAEAVEAVETGQLVAAHNVGARLLNAAAPQREIERAQTKVARVARHRDPMV
jgi:hypothetical protein